MRFPPEFIERLRNHSPLSQVIGKRIAVRRHGREFHALCPFHKEKSPSFTINDDKGFFHCFGCAAHGDAIGFIKDYEGIDYTDAVKRLADELGVQVPAMTREAQESERRRHTVEDTVALAAQWFVKQLHSPSGQRAREYIEGRGLSGKTLEQFGVGYASDSRDALKTEMMRQGVSEAMLMEAGLLAKSDDGRSYNRFRERLIFPIRNSKGKAVAFGGRILPGSPSKNAAKYINSPETPIFKKGEMLFAYDMAIREARDKGTIIVAEGYMDVIALHQAGFTAAVAPLGTAITESQLGLLWRAAPEPVLCLDGDAAGSRAMQRAADLALPLLKPGFSLKFAALPRGEDPDSLIRHSGISAMRQTLAQARILSQVLWDNAVSACGAGTPEQKALLEQNVLKIAERITDPLVKQHMRDYFRERIFSLKRRKNNEKHVVVNVSPAALPGADDAVSHLGRLEQKVVALVIFHPEILHHLDIEERFAHMDFTQAVLDKLRSAVLEISAAVQVDHASLCAALVERGFGEMVESLLHSNNPGLQAKRNAEVVEAMQAFESAHVACLEREIKEAVATCERDMSEQNQNRLFFLQKQRDERRLAHYAISSEE